MSFNQLNRVTLCGIGLAALALALFAPTAVAQERNATGSQALASALDQPVVAITSGRSV